MVLFGFDDDIPKEKVGLFAVLVVMHISANGDAFYLGKRQDDISACFGFDFGNCGVVFVLLVRMA
jgi:hypothetical protein